MSSTVERNMASLIIASICQSGTVLHMSAVRHGGGETAYIMVYIVERFCEHLTTLLFYTAVGMKNTGHLSANHHKLQMPSIKRGVVFTNLVTGAITSYRRF